MNFIDVVVLVVIGMSALIAFSSGFVNVVLWILSWVGAVVATVAFFPAAQPIAERYISNQLMANVVAAVGIFLIALLVCAILNQIISRMVRGSALGALDRSLGLLFGLILGAGIVCGAYMLFAFVAPKQEDWPQSILEARTLPMVQRGSSILRSMVPDYVIAKGAAVIKEGAKTLGEPQNLLPAPGSSAPAQAPAATPETAPAPAPDAAPAQGTGQTQGTNANPGGNPDGQASGAGYKDAQRNDLNRLIQSSQ